MTNKIEIEYAYPFWGPFLMQSKMDGESIKTLLDKGDECRIKGLDNRKHLAGDLDHEYYYDEFESWFPNLFDSYIDAYIDALVNVWNVRLSPEYPNSTNIDNDKFDDVSWNVSGLWINYMQARDFNPPHNHNGDLSFVIYLKVPEELKDEWVKRKPEHNNAGPGSIQFNWGDDKHLSVSNRSYFPATGMVLLFPAWLKHYVVGYRSEVERISVSGNINLNIKYNRSLHAIK